MTTVIQAPEEDFEGRHLSSRVVANLCDTSGRTALYVAAQNGRTAAVRTLIHHGARLNARLSTAGPEQGRTALHAATHAQQTDTVRHLVNAGCDVNIQDEDGFTALHFAVMHRVHAAAHFLLDNGVDVYLQNSVGRTALGYALPWTETPQRGDVSVAEALLDGLWVRAALLHPGAARRALREEDSLRVLLAACFWNLTALAFRILDLGVPASLTDAAHRTPLHYCFLRDDVISEACCRLLLTYGADINVRDKDGNTALNLLMARDLTDPPGYVALVQEVVDTHAQREGDCPLHLSVVHKDAAALRYFCACGVSVNTQDTDGFTALHLTALHANNDLTRVLIDHGADVNLVNRRRQSALHYAAVLSDVTCARLLLKGGAQVNAVDEFGMTPLHKAAGWGSADMVRLLAGEAGDVAALDSSGQSALHLAAIKGHADVCEYLLLRGAQCHLADTKQRRPLHVAARCGDADTIRLLLLHGAPPNAADCHRQTALHVACCHGHAEAVRTLINRGASKNLLDGAGRRPEDLAVERGHHGIPALLREHRESLTLYDPGQLEVFESMANSTTPTRVYSFSSDNLTAHPPRGSHSSQHGPPRESLTAEQGPLHIARGLHLPSHGLSDAHAQNGHVANTAKKTPSAKKLSRRVSQSENNIRQRQCSVM